MADGRIPERLRARIEGRAGGLCEYCRIPQSFSPIPRHSIEHIRPRRDGGETTEENLALSCQGCNNNKGVRTTGKDPEGGEAVPLFHPRRQRWAEHFSWGGDGSLVVGTTPTGRATVSALRLNRVGLVNLRRVLVEAGLHPPPGPGPPIA